MSFDDIPEDREIAEPCDCGGSITQSEHGVWYCDSCSWNSDMGAIQGGIMKIAGVAIDKYKLPVFKKHLDGAGYTFTESPGLSPETLILKVPYKWVHELKSIIEAANKEATK